MVCHGRDSALQRKGRSGRKCGLDAFETYRHRLLLRNARWSSGLSAVLALLGVVATPVGGTPADFQKIRLCQLFLVIGFSAICGSTYLRHRGRTAVLPSIAMTLLGGVGSTLLAYFRHEFGPLHFGSLNFIVLACALLFPWRLWEVAGTFSALAAVSLLPPLWLAPAPGFAVNGYLFGVSVVVGLIACQRSVSLREKEHQAREALEHRSAQLAETSRRLAESVARLEGLDRQKSAFFANVSHELRTPLTLLTGPLAQVRQRIKDVAPPDVEWQLAVMERNAQLLLDRTESLLDLARLDEGKRLTPRTRVAIGPLLQSIVHRFEPHAQHTRVQLELRLTAPSADVLADARGLSTVFSNLLSNALKFTGDGGSVRVALDREGDAAEITVVDTGCGIPEAEQERIFERFARVDAAPSGGTGIGLSLVRSLVELYGGNVSVESAVGRGSTFRVRLPCAEPLAGLTPSLAPSVADVELTFVPPLPPPVAPAPAGSALVLVVEDHPDLRDYLVHVLSGRFRVVAVGSAKEGLAATLEHTPDVIVCDVRLPDGSGLQLTRRLRAEPAGREIPVLLVTAFDTPELRVEALREGAVDFLGKPFSPEELIARIQVQPRLRRLVGEAARAQKLTMLQTLVEGLAHEVRNPLNVIVNSAHVLRRVVAGSADPNAEGLVAVVEEACVRLNSIVSELTAMGKRDPDRLAEWDPESSVESTLRMLSDRCRSVAVERKHGFAGTVRGHPTQLDQVVMNLLDNALRAMPDGGELRITTEGSQNEFRLSVKDGGVGIPAAVLARIFDPFFTTRDVGEGTGLGLHISRRVAEAHGGNIDVNSEPGKGSCFTLRLPLPVQESA